MIIKLFKEYNQPKYWVELTTEEWDDLSDPYREQPKFTNREKNWIETLKRKNIQIFLSEKETSFEMDTNIQLPTRIISHHRRYFHCYKEDDDYFDIDCDLGLYRCDQFDGLKKFIELSLIHI